MYIRFLGVFLIILGLISCQSQDELVEYVEVTTATPIVMSTREFKDALNVIEPQPMEQSGKIYAYKNYIFINEPYKGVHVIDNSSPENPVPVRFITIPGNLDISVKDDYLFADSLSDLIVLDISDLTNIRPVSRLEGVLEGSLPWPIEVDWVRTETWNPEELIVGWEIKEERIPIEEYRQARNNDMVALETAAMADAPASETGTGGSMARFKIVGDYLYAVDPHNINVFDIRNLERPESKGALFAGFDLETIFNRGDYLFLGSRRGMYIYDIVDPSSPQFVSEFEHGTACDPVVVDDRYAYVTLRGGNGCGATESGLYIIDILDISKPELLKIYPMDGPYGLGVKGNLLFVCDGDSGLKVYDKTQVEDLKLVDHFEEVVTYDVIPLENQLLMIGEGTLYQYHYDNEGLRLLSQISLKNN